MGTLYTIFAFFCKSNTVLKNHSLFKKIVIQEAKILHCLLTVSNLRHVIVIKEKLLYFDKMVYVFFSNHNSSKAFLKNAFFPISDCFSSIAISLSFILY